MTIKALHGGKLLCLMAAVAGAMTLGSCKDDDDDPEPTPAPVPVDTTPQKVTFPDEYKFRINNSTPVAFNAGDSIKANTLLSNGANSDTVSIDVILRNNTMVDPSLVSLSLANSYLGSVKISQTPSINDSIYSVSFPAVEGNYSLSINGKTRNFVVASTGKSLSKSGRTLSNFYSVKFDKTTTSNMGITFVPYDKAEDRGARLTATGSFITIDEEHYNTFVNATSLSTVTDFIDDAKPEDGKLMLRDAKYFIYIANGMNYVVKITNFAGSDVETSDLEMVVTF